MPYMGGDGIVGFLHSPLGFLAFALNLIKKNCREALLQIQLQLCISSEMIGLHSRIEPTDFQLLFSAYIHCYQPSKFLHIDIE